jgi:uncharacterized protein YbjT (DUF2867 family)
VLGGTGFVGRAVCQRLAEAGQRHVRVPTRRPLHGNACASCPRRLVQADVHDPPALRALLAGCDAVVNLVAILHGSAAAFEQHARGAAQRTLAQACQAPGVRRVVHVSALGVGPDAPSNYLRSKAAGEACCRLPGWS